MRKQGKTSLNKYPIVPTIFALLMALSLPTVNDFAHALVHLGEGSHLHGHGDESPQHAHGHEEAEHHVANEVESEPQRRISGPSGFLPLGRLEKAAKIDVLPPAAKRSSDLAFVEGLPPNSLSVGFILSSQNHRAPPA